MYLPSPTSHDCWRTPRIKCWLHLYCGWLTLGTSAWRGNKSIRQVAARECRHQRRPLESLPLAIWIFRAHLIPQLSIKLLKAVFGSAGIILCFDVLDSLNIDKNYYYSLKKPIAPQHVVEKAGSGLDICQLQISSVTLGESLCPLMHRFFSIEKERNWTRWSLRLCLLLKIYSSYTSDILV